MSNTNRPREGWFRQVSPILRWVALMILLALVLTLSIRTLVPAPQPAANDPPTQPAGATPTTETAASETATPLTNGKSYDFRGGKLTLTQPLPQAPAEAHVYLLKKDEPATLEQARAFTARFDIQSNVYTAASVMPKANDYVFSDGKQLLQIYSERYFTYMADIAKSGRDVNGADNPNAEAIISDFLHAHGFDFSFRVEASDFYGSYLVQPLAPDSIRMQYESFTPAVMRVTLDENGSVLRIDANLMDYDPVPQGTYDIITAQEALQKLLDDSTPAGKSEFFHSQGKLPQIWYRDYPDNQPVTIHGNVTSYPPANPDQPGLFLIDGVPAAGNLQGMEALDGYALIEATGQYVTENGIREFQVESWKANVEPAYLSGTLHREGDQITLTSDDGSGKQYPLIDPPADLPLDTKIPDSYLSVSGIIVQGKMDWTNISYLAQTSSGGGGGGGGLGFYKLNLSGTPVPFPTATPLPQSKVGQGNTEYVVQENDTLAYIAQKFGITVDELMQANDIHQDQVFTGQKLTIPGAKGTAYTVKEGDTCGTIAQMFGIPLQSIVDLNGLSSSCTISVGQTLNIPASNAPEEKVTDLRGFLSILIHKKADGTQSREYSLAIYQDGVFNSYLLEGSNLNELDAYNGMPVIVSGTVRTGNNASRLKMESYKIPFPELQYQILKGTQKAGQLNGQTVVLFTTEDGMQYVEFMAFTDQPTNAFIGLQGDLIQQELLIVPDEKFGGMPVVRVYQGSIVDPGAPQMQVTANQPQVIDDAQVPEIPNYSLPSLTIDRVELVYFVSNPYYQVNDPSYSQRSPYIQPAWHFHGHYASGDEYDALIQALEQEFLLPEVVPGITPG